MNATAEVTDASPRHAALLPQPRTRAGFTNVLRSEFVKLRSIRSRWIMLISVGALIVGSGIMNTNSLSRQLANPLIIPGYGPISPGWNVLFSMGLAGVLAAILGCITFAGEYGTGAIRTTYTATPRRLRVYAAKAILLAVSTFIVSAVAALIVVFYAANMYSSAGLTSPVTMSQAIVMALSGAGAVAAMALVGLGIGAIVRNPAAAIAITMTVLFVPAIIITGTDGNAILAASALGNDAITLTGYANRSLYGGAWVITVMGAWIAISAWVVVTLGAGAAILRRRDI